MQGSQQNEQKTFSHIRNTHENWKKNLKEHFVIDGQKD